MASPLSVTQCRTVIPKAICTQAPKMNSAGCSYIFVHTYAYMYDYLGNNDNQRRGHELEREKNGLYGKIWREDKKGINITIKLFFLILEPLSPTRLPGPVVI